MKKAKIIFILLLCTCLIMPNVYGAEKTLGTLKKELADLESKLKANEEQANQTEQQRKETQQNINNIKAEIQKANEDINALTAEIEKLNKQMEEKEKEIKNVINFVQVANGESAYMEYIFGAKDFTDFIYRVAVSEQIVKYNDTLIDEYNALIKKNNEKKEELKNKQIELGKKQQELELEMAKLGEKLKSLEEGEQSLAASIKTAKKAVQNLENQKCKDSETATTCYKRLHPPIQTSSGSINTSVPGGVFTRPITSGVVSSEYGNRYHPTRGYYTLHTGIDLANSGSSIPVYASTEGTVAAIVTRASCGGNQIYIHHIVNGKAFTTGYMHLRSINVSVGQYVTGNTVIATMGGNPSIEYWDGCSTGQHLHFIVASGLYYVDYYDYNSFKSHTMNPRYAVSFPSTGGWFSGRL